MGQWVNICVFDFSANDKILLSLTLQKEQDLSAILVYMYSYIRMKISVFPWFTWEDLSITKCTSKDAYMILVILPL